ncbi:MAG: acyl-CoA dehydrogenase family protein [Betaproteobacteria bacterium]|nr:acyl-CoA dehydrogenase family protein [Betaproteobacteria bacterium]MBI3936340.1 acyl-CoA dehydrogenase family protein [Betaproteobacteria bacterium]
MPDYNRMGDEEFRAMVREFFETHYPAHLRFPPRRLRWHEIRDWYLTLSRKGWIAPNWPREHGGMGLDPAKMLIFIEEIERWGVARAPDHGIVQVGPILIEYGTDAQRRTQLRLDMADLASIYARYVEIVKRGGTPGQDVSLLKIWAMETWQRLAELLVETAHEYGCVAGEIDFGGVTVDVLGPFYYSRPATIYGGSSEIQRNILAKYVLKLPS